jgi:F0F1-type ATP synthase beta subunit
MWRFYFWRENEAEGQDFVPGVGDRFRLGRDLLMVVMRKSLQDSSVWCVGQVLCPAGCISIQVAIALSVIGDNLSLQSSRSMFGVLLWIR